MVGLRKPPWPWIEPAYANQSTWQTTCWRDEGGQGRDGGVARTPNLPLAPIRTSSQYKRDKRAQHSYAPHSVCDAASLSPPAGTSGATQITTSTDGQRPCRARLGGGLGAFALLMHHRQLPHGCGM